MSQSKDDFLRELYARRGGIKLGIGRVASAFPVVFDHQMPVYHVAGTNGKGTTVYAIDHILRSNGLKVGRFISPHLLNYNERIAVDDIDIPDENVLEIYKWLEKKISDFDELSFFEITFLIAWKYFELSGCDRAVFEVGLGGRLDATNVIEGPKTDIITSIGLDHTHILGDTLEKIALEKLGIVKNGDRVLIGSSKDAAFDKWMAGVALEKGAKYVVDDELPQDMDITADISSPEQLKNIRLAVKSVLLSEESGINIPDLSDLKLPGRFEYIEPDVIADVAHNPPAITSLVDTVKRKEGKVAVLYSAMKDKDITKVLDLIDEIAEAIFVLNLEGDNRGAAVADIVERASEKAASKLHYAENDNETIRRALAFAKEKGLKLLVSGSFHTIEKFLRFRSK